MSDLISRLRGEYPAGPDLPNGQPEFGVRQFGTPPIQHEAADEITRLRAERDKLLSTLTSIANAAPSVDYVKASGAPGSPYDRGKADARTALESSPETKVLNVRDDAKDCTRCGSGGAVLVKTVDSKTWEPLGVKVSCCECGATGPIAPNMHEAVLAWNAAEAPAELLVLMPEGPTEDEIS